MSQTTKLDWILTIPAIDAIRTTDKLKSECRNVENILENSLAKLGQPYHVRRYGSVPWDGSNGSVPHMIEMCDDMGHLAYDLHMDIKTIKHKLNHIHIIAPHNAAVFVIKFLAFYTQMENRLDKWTRKEFNANWNMFPVSELGDKYPVQSIFRSLIFLQPSLPTPTFFARLLFLPPIYCFTRQLAPLPEVEFIRVFRTLEDPICQNVDLNIDRAFVLPLEDMDKVLRRLFSRDDNSETPKGIPSVTLSNELSTYHSAQPGPANLGPDSKIPKGKPSVTVSHDDRSNAKFGPESDSKYYLGKILSYVLLFHQLSITASIRGVQVLQAP